MYKNFYVTGFGRSGTKFLQTIMNQSKKWDVYHEPRNKFDEVQKETAIEKIQADFNINHYAEVNSYLRFHILKLVTNKMGIIIRDPRDIYLSTMNRGKDYKKMAKDIWIAFYKFSIFNGDCLWIDFYKMTHSGTYLAKVLRYFGIDDVPTFDLNTKVNENKTITYKEFNQLPLLWQSEFYSFDWSFMKDLYRKLEKYETLYFNKV